MGKHCTLARPMRRLVPLLLRAVSCSSPLRASSSLLRATSCALLLGAASCQAPLPPASPGDAPPATAELAPPPPPPPALPTAAPPLTPCQAVGREQRQALGAYLDEIRRFAPQASGRELVAGWCREDPKGLWALEFSEIKVEPGEMVQLPYLFERRGSFTGKIRLMRVDQAGKHVAAEGWKEQVGEIELTTDFDGDGVPELLVPDPGFSGNRTLWTLRGGAVVRYPGTEKLSILRIEDHDKDGRLDIIYSSPFTWSWEEMPLAPEFLAHSLPDGRFSLDDAAAIERAQEQCEGIPATLAPNTMYPESLLTVMCARLRGAPEKTLVPRIKALCRGKFGCQESGAHYAWARAEPLFRLPPAAR